MATAAVPATMTPRCNQLLAALPASELKHLAGELELVWLPAGKVLHESGDSLHHAYFPTTALVALLYVMAEGGSAEVAVIGQEGMIGVALLLGGDSMPNRALVLGGGHAYRLSRQAIKQAFGRVGGRRRSMLNEQLLRYMQALATQMAQTAVCNRYHTVAQQLCRWLLLCLDRSPGDDLIMTQETIANMLGVRREGVTEAAGRLQAAGLIQYNRGHIVVLDRAGLEARACECYGVVRKEYDRLLPAGWPETV